MLLKLMACSGTSISSPNQGTLSERSTGSWIHWCYGDVNGNWFDPAFDNDGDDITIENDAAGTSLEVQKMSYLGTETVGVSIDLAALGVRCNQGLRLY